VKCLLFSEDVLSFWSVVRSQITIGKVLHEER
jgi:hypothetical protein